VEKKFKIKAEIIDSWCDIETNKMYILIMVNDKMRLIERNLFF